MLRIVDVKKHRQDQVIFPGIQLELLEGSTVSIHSSTDLRHILLGFFTGKEAFTDGEIWVGEASMSNSKSFPSLDLGILFLQEGLYERLKVKDQLQLFKKLYGTDVSIEKVYELTQLADVKHQKVKHISYSMQRRVQLARVLFQNPSLYLFEELDQNVDIATKRIFINVVRYLQKNNKGVLLLTGNMESAITLTETVYRLDDTGLHLIEVKQEEEPDSTDETSEEKGDITAVPFHKIPTKVNEKMILFDPPEIDYIESHAGQSNVHIRGEAFACMFTLNDLESKLQSFGFFRCHRSYIVNLQKVREIITWTKNSYSLKLEDAVDSEIPLSKNKMAELKDMLGLK
ncbi:LytTR family transcriptional regulator DNA-binding domain-containing protein [Salibacterium lacus]|uniref:LytTR family transcriptional regulator DNA-binding domain-containing protein n=1 Tax=Salibacterium lacus TaxID=1898109 RepID=A0ABW5T716_9BACI